MLELGLLAAAGYATAVGGLYALQERMLFPRAATRPAVRPLPAGAERWSLEVAAGERLHGVRVPARSDTRTTVVGFPGNAWNAQDFALFLSDCLPAAEVVAFHYRGYAPSEGEPGEAALVADGLAVVDAVMTRGIEARPLVPVGVSLGTGVVAHVVAERPVAGAVLVSPFDSIRAVAAERYPWAPVRALLRHPFDSAARLAGVDRPIAVISAARDELVRPERTTALVRRIVHLVRHDVVADADHHSLYDEPSFADLLHAAVEDVGSSAAARVTGRD